MESIFKNAKPKQTLLKDIKKVDTPSALEEIKQPDNLVFQGAAGGAN